MMGVLHYCGWPERRVQPNRTREPALCGKSRDEDAWPDGPAESTTRGADVDCPECVIILENG